MISRFKKIIHFALTGTFTVVLAACYGAPVELQDYKLLKTTDESNNPIEGLQLDLKQNGDILQTKYTDSYGMAEFQNVTELNLTVSISDIDGEENGGLFLASEVDVNNENEFDIILKKQ